MHPHVLGRRQRPRSLTHQFERCYLEPQLIASAYECACPMTRRTQSSGNQTPAAPQRARACAAAGAASWGG